MAAAPPSAWRRWGERRLTLASVWLLTRVGWIALEVWLPPGPRGRLRGDPSLYVVWARGLAAGQVPVQDVRWQYPPAAVLALALPQLLAHLLRPLLHPTYLEVLVALVVLTDAATQWLLTRRALRGADSWLGAWTWCLGLALVGPIVIDRFDVLPAALSVVAALGVAEATGGEPGTATARLGAAAVAGAAVALGALVKVWPLVLAGAVLGALIPAAVGEAAGRRRDPSARAGPGAASRVGAAIGGALLATGTVALILAGAGELTTSVTSFVAHQSRRGLQVESLSALPRVLRATGSAAGLQSVYRDGAFQFTGSHTQGVAEVAAVLAAVALVATVVAGAWLGRQVGTSAALDAVAAGLGVVLCLAEVLSPQYLIWLVALLSAALTRPESRLAPALPTAALACGLTGVLFPFAYPAFLDAAIPAVILVTVRDLALLITVVALVSAAAGPLVGSGTHGNAGRSRTGPRRGHNRATTSPHSRGAQRP